MMPRNPIEADWLIRSAEEEAARAERWAAIAQQHAAYRVAMARAHAADAEGLRALWSFEPLLGLHSSDHLGRTASATVMKEPPLELVEPPKCEFCGKPTRIWHGKPQRFCSFPKTAIGYSCSHRWRDRQIAERKKKARSELQAVDQSEVSCAEVGERPTADPSCQHCGKPTRIWHGKAQKFCSPPPDRHVSPCASAFHDLARRARSMRRTTRKFRRAAKQPETVRPSGSVLATASPRAPGHAILASVTQAVPQHLPDDLRSEIISETMVLVLEGTELPQAVTQASKSVRKNAAPLRYTKPIEDCFWLAAEAPD